MGPTTIERMRTALDEYGYDVVVLSNVAAAEAAERQAAALERIAAAQEKEEQWVYNHYLKLDALVGEIKRIAAVLERADNLSKMFDEKP